MAFHRLAAGTELHGVRCMTAPCRGCLERHLGCHDQCERYQAFVKYRQEVRQKRRDDLHTEYLRVDVTQKIKNYQNQHKRR